MALKPKLEKKPSASASRAPAAAEPAADNAYGAPAGMPAFLMASTAIQAKLRARSASASGAADEPRTPTPRAAGPFVQRKCACGGGCARCREEDSELNVQRLKRPGGTENFQGIPATAGHSLPMPARQALENHFQTDLSSVRVHTENPDAQSADGLNALAYTSGRDIYFADGMYAPGSDSGRRLLAHEVAHVVQQGAGKKPALAAKSADGVRIGAPGDILENEADRAADAFVGGESPAAIHSQTDAFAAPRDFVQRQPGPDDSDSYDPYDDDFALVLGDGTVLRNDEKLLRQVVNDRIYQHGLDAGDTLLEQVNNRLSLVLMFGTPRGKRASAPMFDLIMTLQSVVDDIDVSNEFWLEVFAGDAESVLESTLKDSEMRIKSELLRYGIEEHVLIETRHSHHTFKGEDFDTTREIRHTSHTMDTDTTSVKSLSAAAQILLQRRRDLDNLTSEQNSHLKTKCWKADCWDYPDAQYAGYTPLIDEATKNYGILFEGLKAEFPVLASFGSLTQRPTTLATLADGPSPEAAEKIAAEAADKLDNIDKTRDGLKTPEGSIWKLSRIVNLTKAAKGISDDSYYGKIIQHRIDDLSNSWVELALTVLAIAFALLAPVTGGLSLVVTAAISTGVAIEHIKEYEFESAAAGTDFDQARAIADDPSLFWVALDVVGAVLDIAGGLGEVTKALKAAKLVQARAVFEAFAPSVKAAAAARTTEEFDAAVRAIRNTAAETEKGELIAKKVIDTLERQRAAHGAAEVAFGATKPEAEALAEAAESGRVALEKAGGDIEKEALESLEESVKISTYGGVWTCHSPCMLFRERYARALEQEPALKKELQEVEDIAKKAAANREDKALVKDAKRRARALEAKLRAVRTPERISFLNQLTELHSVHPSVGAFPPEAFERILSVRQSLDKATGQLLEEMLNAGMATREAREASAGVEAVEAARKAGAELEFLPGYMLRDENGRLITDGILGYRDKDVFRVVQVFESKAGEEAAQKLVAEATKMSKKGWRELRQYAADAVREDLIEGGRLSERQVQSLEKMSADQIRRAYPAEYKKVFNQAMAEEAGQARRTLERLAPGGDNPTNLFRVDDATPMKITAGPVNTQVTGLVPANVDPADLLKGLQAQRLNVDILKSQLTQGELRTIAQSIIDQATARGL
jgi:Domain of unknown function (DUF4157)